MGEPLIKLKKNKFEISNDQIAIYQNPQIKLVFFAIAIMMLFFNITFIYVGLKYKTFNNTMPLLVANIILMFFFFFIGNFSSKKKIVFDKVTQTVYSITGNYFKKHLINFNEIYAINKSESVLTGLYYRIQPINVKVGNGIKISAPYPAHINKEEKKFVAEILPKLQAMVFQKNSKNIENTNEIINENTASATIQNKARLENIVFKKFKISDGGNTYSYFSLIDILFFLLAAIAFCGLIYAAATNIPKEIAEGKVSWSAYAGLLMFTLVSVYFMYKNSQKIIINKGEKTITQTNFFGLIKSTSHFYDFEKFLSVKHYTNGIYTGTELKLIFNNKKTISVENKYNTQKIQTLIDELNILILND